MANTIKLKSSTVAGRVPTTSDLALRELAVNTTDGKLFIKKSVGGVESIVEIGASGSTSSFLRSDADDEATGVIDFLGGTGGTPAIRIRSGGSSWSEGLAIHPSSNSGYALTFFRTRAALNDSTNTWAIGNLGEGSTNNFGLLRSGLTGGSGIRVDSVFDVTQAGAFRFGFTPTVGSSTIWHAGNDGAGSGLDADLLDGLNSASFVRSDANTTLNGDYTFSSSSLNTTLSMTGHGGAANYNYFLNAFNDTGVKAIHFVNGSTRAADGGENTYTIRNDGGSLRLGNSSYPTLLEGNVLTYNSNTIWHAGNDGAASGLDADLLDGLNSDRFLRSSGFPGYGNWNDFGNAQQTVYEVYQENFNAGSNTGSTNFPTNRGYSYGALMNFGANSNARAQVYISHAGNDLIFRGGWGTSGWQTWNRVWTDINDGAGSGLDADLLDGLNGSQFLRSDASTTNTVDIRAPIFYDSNDTAYYVDPAGGNARISRDLYISDYTGGNYGNRLIVGNTNTSYTIQDTNLRPTIQTHGAYPVISLNHTITSNSRHGPTLQFTNNGTGNQFVFGTNGTGTQIDLGTSSTGDWNPHNGIDNYLGTTGLRMDTSGNIYNFVSTRSPVYYDQNNTGYYLNPAGFSELTWARLYGDWSTSGVHGEQLTVRGTYASMCLRATNGNQAYWLFHNDSTSLLFYGGRGAADGSNWDWGAKVYGNSDGLYLEGRNSLRAPIFYDTENTGYYCDPNGTSRMGYMRPNSISVVGSQDNGTPRWDFKAYVVESQHHYGQNSTQMMYLGESNPINVPGDLRVPILYDYNNTAYYVDGNSESRLYRLRVGPYTGSTSSGNQTGLEIFNTSGTGDGDVAAISFHCGGHYGMHMHLRHDSYFGIGGWSASTWRWYVQTSTGDMTAAGNVTAYSDIRLKEEIAPLENSLDKLMTLNGVSFRWKDLPDIVGHPGEKDFGIIAQEVEKVFPEVIHESAHESPDGDKYKTVAYDKLVPVLLEAIKELKAEVDNLKSKLAS